MVPCSSTIISKRTIFIVYSLCFVAAFSAENLKMGNKSDGKGKVEDICLLPSSTGPCFAYFEMWFYNATTKKCEEFIYGGCEGNGNRFESKAECESKCSKAAITHRSVPKGPCTIQLNKVSKGMIGAYIPQCDDRGYYEHRQCWGSVGSCWCVDKMGKKVSSVEEKPGSFVKLDCEYPCSKAYQKALKAPVLLRGVPIPLPLNQYVFLPSCDKEGYYLPKQCHTASGKCWCVDGLGTKIPGTETSTDTDKLQCS